MSKDTIYRQDVINAFDCSIGGVPVESVKYVSEYADKMMSRINTLSSVEPERKTGKWIYITDGHYEYFKCDQCEKHSGEPTPFCRYCGADMRERQDEQRT